MKTAKSARQAAFELLMKIDGGRAYSTIAVNAYFEKYSISDEDKSLAAAIAYTTVQNRLRIDYIINFFVKRKTEPAAKIILETAICQLEFFERVPDYAVVNESADLARQIKKPYLSGFINGVLRQYLRNKDSISYNFNSREEFLSVYYSYPVWLVKRITAFYESAEDILKEGNKTAPFTLRANTLKIKPDILMKRLEEEKGITVKRGNLCCSAIICAKGFSPPSDSLFREGLYYAQSEASMLVSEIAGPEKGQNIIDLCAAPGGKTTHMAELMENTGRITAFDIHAHKIELIKTNAERLGIKIIKAKVWNAVNIDEGLADTADIVLADVPCSGTGVIRRKPEIKWTKSEADIKSLAALQRSILEAGARYVKKDGFLVYSTCSIDKEENEDVINRFLEKNKSFRLYGFDEKLPSSIKEQGKQGFITILPGDFGSDGFFIAKFKRIQ